MKKFFLFLIPLLMFVVMGCEDDSESDSTLCKQTWKCIGFASVGDAKITPIHSGQENLPSECFTIKFNINGTVCGATENEFYGSYHLSGKNHISFSDVYYSSLVFLTEKNIQYDNVLFKQVNSYSVTNDELRLYFDEGKQYLIYHPEIGDGFGDL